MAFAVCLFGSFRVETLEGLNVTPRGRKAAALLSYCLIAAPKPIRREQLAEILWGDRGEEQARASLRQALYELRDIAHGKSGLLVIDRIAVRAERSAFTADLDSVSEAAGSKDAEAMLKALTATSDIFLSDLNGVSSAFDDWLVGERVRQHEERRRLALELAEQALAGGCPAIAGRIAETIIAADPIDESAVQLAIEASCTLGDIDHGRRIFARLEASLLRDLAVAPSAKTIACHDRLQQASVDRYPVAIEEQPAIDARPLASPLLIDSVVRTTPRPVRWRTICSAGLASLALGMSAWIIQRPSASDGRHVLVQQLRVDASDPPAQLLRQSLTTDLSRMVVGNDTTLDFSDSNDGTNAKVGADYFVSGDARTNAGMVHAAVRLENNDNRRILWSHDFSGSSADIAGLRQQIAAKIADVMICALGFRSRRPADIDIPTLRLFLAGCESWHTDSPAASKYFQQVVQRRPDFAQARALLAASLSLSTGTFSGLAPTEWEPLRRQAIMQARHALAQDSHLGAAYFALAASITGNDRNLKRLAILEKGGSEDPEDGSVQTSLAVILDGLGLTRAANDHMERASGLDPFSPIDASNLAESYAYGGRMAEATKILDQASHFWPGEFYTSWTRFEVAARLGDAVMARAMLPDSNRKPEYTPSHPDLWRAFIEARATPTKEKIEKAQADLLEAEPNIDNQGRVEIIQDLVQLGRIDQAYAVALHRPAISSSWNFVWFRGFMAPFRKDPRFRQVLDAQGISAMWRRLGKKGDFCNQPGLPYRCPS